MLARAETGSTRALSAWGPANPKREGLTKQGPDSRVNLAAWRALSVHPPKRQAGCLGARSKAHALANISEAD